MLIKLTLDRFEGDQSILIGENGAKVSWPKDHLPAGAHEGMVLSFEILELSEREKKDRQSAQDIVNEIINKS